MLCRSTVTPASIASATMAKSSSQAVGLTPAQVLQVHQATASPIAAEALRRIAELYAIEAAIRGRPPSLGKACAKPDRCR